MLKARLLLPNVECLSADIVTLTEVERQGEPGADVLCRLGNVLSACRLLPDVEGLRAMNAR